MQRNLFESQSKYPFKIQKSRDGLRLAFHNFQVVRRSKQDIIDALKSTPCTVKYPYDGKSDGGYGSTLIVECPSEEWERGAASILREYQDDDHRGG